MMTVAERPHREIFALDIGTRSIIGMVGIMDQKRFRILAQDIVEHDSRAMYDGQIHDIPRVAEVISRVKANLEEKVGYRLTEVAVAAAGRSLQTKRSNAEMQVDENSEITENQIRSLELAALRQAQDELDAEVQQAQFPEAYYCVGHYPVSYSLDDLIVTNLLGHRGRSIWVELIATFIPASVVNGLFSALSRAGLEPVNLTLEPIAALEVAIPSGMRLLNLALVDIGAGTADIAITNGGTVMAYAMIPVAGDEVTEAIVEGCLVDFQEAEGIKRQLWQNAEISYTDILGAPHTASKTEIMTILEPVLDRLVDEIVNSITDLNGGQAPKSVICVGGGIQVPDLTGRIAVRLGIPENLVGIRGRDIIRNLETPAEDPLGGPVGVTVVGIGVLALEKAGYSFVNVTVNGEKCWIFNTRSRKTIGKLAKLQGLDFETSRILVNGAPVTENYLVKNGDQITVDDVGKKVASEKATSANASANDSGSVAYLPAKGFKVTVNGEKLNLTGDKACLFVDLLNYLEPDPVAQINGMPELRLNGERAGFTDMLKDGDEIIVEGFLPKSIK